MFFGGIFFFSRDILYGFPMVLLRVPVFLVQCVPGFSGVFAGSSSFFFSLMVF